MIRGWCPTVHAPMPSGDGLLARVKPFGGRLPRPALAALAEAVAAFGNGVIELTSRGNLQVRGVHAPAAFARAMVQAGLADPNPEREARRNVTTLPGCNDALVAAVEALLSATPGLAPKFGVTVRETVILVGGRGIENVEALRTYLNTVMPGLDPGSHGVTQPPSVAPAIAVEANVVSQHRSGAVDARVTPWHDGDSHFLYPPFGQTDAATLAHLATLAPEIRTTPWRAFLSPVPAPGFATEPGTVTACPGAPACRSGTTPARADAARLQAAGFTHLHVSGCAKGCAYPGATTTLTGRDGRYDLIRHGRAGDTPDLTGLTLAAAMAAL